MMKFRAVLDNAQSLRDFHNIIMTLAKLSREYTIKVTGDRRMCIMANDDISCTAPLVWVDIDVDAYFVEYILESQHDEIVFSVDSQEMARAFASLRHPAKSVTMRFTRIRFKCLTIEGEVSVPDSEHPRVLTHDIPMVLVSPDCWDSYKLPTVPQCNFGIYIAVDRVMRNMMDKIKNISPTITLNANTKGVLHIALETTRATLTTTYEHLKVKRQSHQNQGAMKDLEASCPIDAKKAALFLNALQWPAMVWLCNIEENQSIHMEMDISNGVSIHTIWPAVCY